MQFHKFCSLDLSKSNSSKESMQCMVFNMPHVAIMPNNWFCFAETKVFQVTGQNESNIIIEYQTLICIV